QLCHDPQWRSLIIDQPDVKGVEDLSYQGVRLRIWLKTKPGEQWPVARELRLRLKTALEQAGVSIGIPKQAFLLQSAEESTS
ncbi:MAG: mechanosensitive ion channel family protein, partial [Microcystaceae cyanobacterium]